MTRTKASAAVVPLAVVLAFVSAPALRGDTLNEPFESASFPPTGWIVRNQSDAIGTNATCWNHATTSPWVPAVGNGHAAADFHCTAATNTISGWLISRPLVNLQNGNPVSFWTRTAAGRPEFPDRLQVRVCIDTTPDSCGAAGSTGTTSSDVGGFTLLQLDINPTLTTGVYPVSYTQQNFSLSGLPGSPSTGRIAFRYFVTNGGPTGANSNAITIDQVNVFDNVPVELMTFVVE